MLSHRTPITTTQIRLQSDVLVYSVIDAQRVYVCLKLKEICCGPVSPFFRIVMYRIRVCIPAVSVS